MFSDCVERDSPGLMQRNLKVCSLPHGVGLSGIWLPGLISVLAGIA